jgi:hypothetical protein
MMSMYNTQEMKGFKEAAQHLVTSTLLKEFLGHAGASLGEERSADHGGYNFLLQY